jgi:hypothetical protein
MERTSKHQMVFNIFMEMRIALSLEEAPCGTFSLRTGLDSLARSRKETGGYGGARKATYVAYHLRY